MKKNRGAIILLLFCLITAGSCKKDNNSHCISYSNADVVKVTAPANTAVNQPADVTISYYLYNGCGLYQGMETSTANNITTISLKAKYEGCVCTAVLLSGEVVYKFSAAVPGTYYLRFPQPGGRYIADTIVVN